MIQVLLKNSAGSQTHQGKHFSRTQIKQFSFHQEKRQGKNLLKLKYQTI